MWVDATHSTTGAVHHPIDGVLHLVEHNSYRLSHPLRYRGRPLPDEGRRLDLGWFTGRLRLHHGDDPVEVEVGQAPGRLDAATHVAMLRELDAWLAGLSLGVEAPEHQRAGRRGLPLAWLLAGLDLLLPAFERAAGAWLDHARTERLVQREPCRPDRVRHVDARLLAAHARRAPLLPHRTGHDTLDTPANRWLVGQLRRALEALDETARRLRRAADRYTVQETFWYSVRADRFQRTTDQLRRHLRRSTLDPLASGPPTEGALLVVQGDPVAARLDDLCRLFLAPRLADEGEAVGARPTFELYELWTLLAVRRLVDPQARWRPHGLRELLTDPTRAASAGFSAPDGASLLYQPTFSRRHDLPALDAAGRVALYKERRPDLTLRHPDGRWLALDAKYTGSPEGLDDCMASAVTYTTTLRWDGRPPEAALLLVPRHMPARADVYTAAWRQRTRTGAVELRPGMGEAATAERQRAVSGQDIEAR